MREERPILSHTMLLVDFSLAFNTIIPQQLVNKLSPLAISIPMCNWLLDFLTNRLQSVRVGDTISLHRVPTRMCSESTAVYAADT